MKVCSIVLLLVAILGLSTGDTQVYKIYGGHDGFEILYKRGIIPKGQGLTTIDVTPEPGLTITGVTVTIMNPGGIEPDAITYTDSTKKVVIEYFISPLTQIQYEIEVIGM